MKCERCGKKLTKYKCMTMEDANMTTKNYFCDWNCAYDWMRRPKLKVDG